MVVLLYAYRNKSQSQEEANQITPARQTPLISLKEYGSESGVGSARFESFDLDAPAASVLLLVRIHHLT